MEERLLEEHIMPKLNEKPKGMVMHHIAYLDTYNIVWQRLAQWEC